MTKQPIAALLTDFGFRDHYVGTMKGAMLKINPLLQIVDICHEVPPGQVTHGAFLLKAAYHYFPPETIFLTVIDPGVGSERKALLVKTENYTFVGPDNGVLSYALRDETIIDIIELNNSRYFLYPVSHTFHGRDIFAPVTAHLSKGVHPERFGPRLQEFKQLSWPEPEIEDNVIEGIILIADHFGNLITNISAQLISSYLLDNHLAEQDELALIKDETNQQLPLEQLANYQIKLGDWRIKSISYSYADSEEFALLAIIGSTGLLEIAVNNGNAQTLLGCYGGEPLTLEISPKKVG